MESAAAARVTEAVSKGSLEMTLSGCLEEFTEILNFFSGNIFSPNTFIGNIFINIADKIICG